jgi:hypothetical protein
MSHEAIGNQEVDKTIPDPTRRIFIRDMVVGLVAYSGIGSMWAVRRDLNDLVHSTGQIAAASIENASGVAALIIAKNAFKQGENLGAIMYMLMSSIQLASAQSRVYEIYQRRFRDPSRYKIPSSPSSPRSSMV